MRILFDESKAAAQCKAYARARAYPEGQTQALLDRAYSLGLSGRFPQERWVSKALDNDGHKSVGIISLFSWGDSAEGVHLWSDIHQARVEDR